VFYHEHFFNGSGWRVASGFSPRALRRVGFPDGDWRAKDEEGEPMTTQTRSAVEGEEPGEPEWLNLVRQQVGSLRYGIVQIIVHEGGVIQIEKTERLRLKQPQTEKHSS